MMFAEGKRDSREVLRFAQHDRRNARWDDRRNARWDNDQEAEEVGQGWPVRERGDGDFLGSIVLYFALANRLFWPLSRGWMGLF